MSTVVLQAIAREVAKLERVVDPPTGPLGYGTDLSCSFDLDVNAEVSGVTVLAQALARRLDCPRGGLPDDPDYGEDLRGMLNRGSTESEVNSISRRVQSELLKDDRVSFVQVATTPLTATGSSLRVTIRVTPVDPTLGTFSMILAVTEASVLIEAVNS